MTGGLALPLAGLAVSALLAVALPSGETEAGGALRGLFVAAPLAICLLALLPAWRLPGRPGGGLQLGAAAALGVAALAGSRLGLRYGESLGPAVLAAAMVLLLAWAVGERLAALATPAASAPAARPDAKLALLVMTVYLAVLPWSTALRPPDGDEPYYLLVAHSLAYDFDADLADNYARQDSLRFMPRAIAPQEGDPVGARGELYSRHGLALPLALAPAYRVGGKLGAQAVMALLAALLVKALVRLGWRYFPDSPRGVVLAAAAAGLSPPLLLYSHQVWVEVPAALLAAQGLLGVRQLTDGGPASRGAGVRLAAAALILPLLKTRFLLISVPLLVLAVLRSPPELRRRARWGLIGALAVGAGLLLLNLALFGQALRHIPVGAFLDQLAPPGAYLRAPFGLLFDCAFGLFASAPIWLLLAPAGWELGRRHRRFLIDALVVGLPYLLLLAPRQGWYGSWSPPFRYAMVLLPLLALALVPVLARRGAVRHPLVLLLGGATAALALLWLLLPGWTYNFADGRSHLLDHLSRLAGSDVARFFPSQLRPRAANPVWALALPVLALLAWRGGWRWRRHPAVAQLLAAASIVALPALLLAARQLPLRVVEFEDPYVVKSGGELYPERWYPVRDRLPGGWELGAGDRLDVSLWGDGRLRITLRLRNASPGLQRVALELLRGEQTVATITLPPSDLWHDRELPEIDWPAESRLGLRVPPEADGRLIVDRALLGWRPGPREAAGD